MALVDLWRETDWASRITPLCTILLGVFAAAWLFQTGVQYARLAAIPIVGADLGGKEQRRLAYLGGARKLYNDGYKKFKDGMFQITTSRNATIIVLDPKFLPELNKLPNSVLSMEKAVDESMETKYTRIETHVPIAPGTITGKLTPALSRLSSRISQEVEEVLALELPPSQDWNEVVIHQKLLRIVAMVSGFVFIGPELCRTEKYLDTAINYTMDVMHAQRAVQQMKPWMRPFLSGRLPQLKKLYQRIAEADEFMRPVINLRKKVTADTDAEKPDDMLQWLIEALPKYPDANSQNLTKVQLGLSFAAIHTTTLAATNAFYNLAAMQEYIPILREEAAQALAENDGILTARALQSMKKMDSFLKETLRMAPATMASFQRKVLRPITLSNGQQIPADVTIEIPAVSVNSDPSIFPDPLKFDGLRFYNLRQDGPKESAALHQFVSVNPSSLTFGYGRHACPGRFFAANEIKMILTHVLLQQDMKLADGATERYPNIEFGSMSIPDPSKKLLFRAKQ
ncbi:hypothetical protein SCUCBS95973_003141 [Sporothrix curviconia]|uniref:Cytochrome P450 n=1 Tax=Sporothrix curviconia TaxID=1260050 RepID=A0ABP0BCP5_9PEZI